MQSLADRLPDELARQVDPEWRRNEAAYWAVREELLEVYHGKWIGFAGGKVVAIGIRPVLVERAAEDAAEHPFVTCVGHEDEPFRVRRASFPYDITYPGEPLPVVQVELRRLTGVTGVVFDRFIADTGSDVTILPTLDLLKLGLSPNRGRPSLLRGVAGGSAATFRYSLWLHLDGLEVPCQLHVDPIGHERLLGRDVLNSFDVLFRGPSGEVVFSP